VPGAFNRYGSAVATLERQVRVDGGFAFGDARGGMWTEGTEQVALVMELSGRDAEARRAITAAQTMRAADGSYFATNARQLATGLPLDTDQSQSRQYFHLVHLAPAAWAALVERRYNPFTGTNRLPN
jgi:hypothetical protein